MINPEEQSSNADLNGYGLVEMTDDPNAVLSEAKEGTPISVFRHDTQAKTSYIIFRNDLMLREFKEILEKEKRDEIDGVILEGFGLSAELNRSQITEIFTEGEWHDDPKRLLASKLPK